MLLMAVSGQGSVLVTIHEIALGGVLVDGLRERKVSFRRHSVPRHAPDASRQGPGVDRHARPCRQGVAALVNRQMGKNAPRP